MHQKHINTESGNIRRDHGTVIIRLPYNYSGGVPERGLREWQITLTLLTCPGSMGVAVWNRVEKDPVDSSGTLSMWAT